MLSNIIDENEIILFNFFIYKNNLREVIPLTKEKLHN